MRFSERRNFARSGMDFWRPTATPTCQAASKTGTSITFTSGPAATLWSIAAGPLVNVMLVPVLLAAWQVGVAVGLQKSMPDLAKFLLSLNLINASLLVFNMLPIYPLDGGQI